MAFWQMSVGQLSVYHKYILSYDQMSLMHDGQKSIQTILTNVCWPIACWPNDSSPHVHNVIIARGRIVCKTNIFWSNASRPNGFSTKRHWAVFSFWVILKWSKYQYCSKMLQMGDCYCPPPRPPPPPKKTHLCLKESSKVLFTHPIGLHHPLDGVTNPEFKLLHFIQVAIFCKEKKALAFNQDRCCHLVLCLQLILFH